MGWQEISRIIDIFTKVGMVIWILLIALLLYTMYESKKKEDKKKMDNKTKGDKK